MNSIKKLAPESLPVNYITVELGNFYFDTFTLLFNGSGDELEEGKLS